MMTIFQKIGNIPSIIIGTNTSEESHSLRAQHLKWLFFQQNQLLEHFEKSDIFQRYLTIRPDFSLSVQTGGFDSTLSLQILTHHQIYFDYVFGNFSAFIRSPCWTLDTKKYVMTILDFYDLSKGYSRVLFGDSNIIQSLREFTITEDSNKLINFPFQDYTYDYGKLHAHTVVLFSLSSLCALLVQNFLAHIYSGDNLKKISYQVCVACYQEHLFGPTIKQTYIPITKTEAINIHTPNPNVVSRARNTWPKVNKCRSCERHIEESWGKHGLCYHCHVCVVCTECGAISNGEKTENGEPVCNFHKKALELKG